MLLRSAVVASLVLAASLFSTRTRADNPIIRSPFTADPAALVSGGKVYLYTGHDEAPVGGKAFVMRDWRVYSSADLRSWTDHGAKLSVSSFAWAKADAWAGHVVEKGGRFYWYVTVEHRTAAGKAIGVAVGDSPLGPFRDARGSALVTNAMTRHTDIAWDDIDPAVFVDDDGQAYLYWGNTVLKWAKLKPNMVELDGSPRVIELPQFTEAPWVHKRGSLYYLSFAQAWPEKISYATAPSPAGPWTFRGVIMQPNFDTPTNHQAIIEHQGESYIIYHTAALPSGGEYRRSVAVERLAYRADGTIPPTPQTSTGLDGTSRRLESLAASGRFVRHVSFDAKVEANVTPALDARWQLVPGLSGAPGTVSFASVNAPGYYLRHVSFDFVLGKHDGSAAFKGDATFRQVPGLSDASGASFQAVNYPERYLRNVGGSLKLELTTTAAARGEATFRLLD